MLATAQKRPTQTLVYDKLTLNMFREMSDGSLERVKGAPTVPGHGPFQLKVINVNSLKYAVEIKVQEEESFKSVPPALEALFPAIGPLELGSKLLAGIGSKGVNSKGIEGYNDDAETKFNNQIDQINTDLQTLEQCLNCYSQLVGVQDKIMDIASAMPDPAPLAQDSTKDPREPGRTALANLRKAVDAAVSTHLETLIKNNIVMSDARGKPTSASDVDIPSLGGNLVGKFQKSYQDLQTDYAAFQQAYDDYKASVSTASIKAVTNAKAEDAVTLSVLDREIDKKQKDVEKRLDEAAKVVDDYKKNERANQKTLLKSANLVKKVMTEDVFEVEGTPVSPRGDIIHISIKFHVAEDKPESDKDLLATIEPVALKPQDAPQVDVDVKVVGRTKIDYSAGIFFTNLTDGNYSIQSVGGHDSIVRGPADNFNSSYGALAHIYKTSTSKVIPALSFGVGSGSGGPTFMLGPSLIVGDQQRFVFSFGIAARSVRRLNGVSEGPFTGTDIPTTNVMRAGIFFGVTFNILQK